MRITADTKNDLAILKFSGKLIFDESLLSLRDEIAQLLRSGVSRFIFDISGVPYCDSSGCGEIIAAYSTIRKTGGTVAVLSPTERVRVLWARIKLADVLPIFDRLEDAESYLRR